MPVMLWVRNNVNDQEPPSIDRREVQLLIVDSIEEGMETLLRQPVDILLMDLLALSSCDPELLQEIARCWPYLICLVTSDEAATEKLAQVNTAGLSVLPMKHDKNSLDKLFDKEEANEEELSLLH